MRGDAMTYMNETRLSTWMTQEFSKWFVIGLFQPACKWGIHWGYNFQLPTFDPNFKRDIQVVILLHMFFGMF